MLCFILPWAVLLKCQRGTHLHGNPSSSDISTTTPQPMGEGKERMRVLTHWNPVVQFRRRCNLCNFGDYACQDEHDDFWSNKQVKHSYTLLHQALQLISVFIISALRMHFITALLLHVGLSHVGFTYFSGNKTLMSTNPFAQVPVYDMNVLWPVRKKNGDVIQSRICRSGHFLPGMIVSLLYLIFIPRCASRSCFEINTHKCYYEYYVFWLIF